MPVPIFMVIFLKQFFAAFWHSVTFRYMYKEKAIVACIENFACAWSLVVPLQHNYKYYCVCEYQQ